MIGNLLYEFLKMLKIEIYGQMENLVKSESRTNYSISAISLLKEGIYG